MHYCLTKRDDTEFWRACRHDLLIPDSLQEKLALWQKMWPNNDRTLGALFPDYSYISILAGMGVLPERNLPLLDYEEDDSELHFAVIRGRVKKLMSELPDHRSFLTGMGVVR